MATPADEFLDRLEMAKERFLKHLENEEKRAEFGRSDYDRWLKTGEAVD
jgi:hypothetical protein